MKRVVGKKGEDIAEKFLLSQGYEILERNFRTRIGEIDIVASANQEIIFVEVKTRTSDLYGLPQESITKAKLAKLRKLAYIYLAQHNIENKHFRIDIISIQLSKSDNVAQIDHIKNV